MPIYTGIEKRLLEGLNQFAFHECEKALLDLMVFSWLFLDFQEVVQ